MRSELNTLRKLARRWLERGPRRGWRQLELRRRSFYVDLWRRSAAEVGATVDELGRERLLIERGAVWTVVRRFEVPLDSRIRLELAGDKEFGYRRLEAAGLPLPGRLLVAARAGKEEWGRVMDELGDGPVALKPAGGGSAGKGVTTSVSSSEAFGRALRRARAYDDRVLVERQVAGASYRLLYLRGRFIDAVRRESPTLVGDGRRTLRALLAAENAARIAGDVAAFHLLVDDLELRMTLGVQGLSLDSVPEAGTRVVVKGAVNQGSAHDAESARETAHPGWIELGARAARALRVEWAGVDVLARDLSAPPADGGVIHEVNTTPGLHHHFLLRDPGKAAPVARVLLEDLLQAPDWVEADPAVTLESGA